MFSKLCLTGFLIILVISTCLAYIFAYTGQSHENPFSLVNVKNYDNQGKLNTIYSP
ncbi:hypothetical protein IKS57_04420 [bacterium]|nr:hypothetical protein [bacterium]